MICLAHRYRIRFVVDRVEARRTTISSVAPIDARVLDENINNTRVYSLACTALMRLKRKKVDVGRRHERYSNTHLDRVGREYEKKYQTAIEPMDLNSRLDSPDANYPRREPTEDAIEDWHKKSEVRKTIHRSTVKNPSLTINSRRRASFRRSSR